MSADKESVIYVRLYSFPLKLYDVIAIADPKVIRWINNGTAFKVFDTKAFEESLLPLYYRHSKITSFQRQLNLYGFKRMTKGEDAGAYCHPKFVQGERDQVKEIKKIALLKNEETISSDDTIKLEGNKTLEDVSVVDEPSRGIKRVNSSGSFTDETNDSPSQLDAASASPSSMDIIPNPTHNQDTIIRPSSPGHSEMSNDPEDFIDALFDVDLNSEQSLRMLYSPYISVSV